MGDVVGVLLLPREGVGECAHRATYQIGMCLLVARLDAGCYGWMLASHKRRCDVKSWR
jgi:hypothetical protein